MIAKLLGSISVPVFTNIIQDTEDRGRCKGERRVLREEDQFQFYFYVLVLSSPIE